MCKMENVEDLRKIYSCTTITPELYNYSMYGRTTIEFSTRKTCGLWPIAAENWLLLILDG